MNRQQHFINLFFGMGLNVLLGIITTPIITRLVDPQDYGELSLFILFGNIFLIISMLGLEQAYVRYFYHSDEVQYKQYILKTTATIPVLISVLSAAIIAGIYYISEHKAVILLIFAVQIVFLAIGNFTSMTLRLKLRTTLYSFVINIQKIIYVALTILAVSFSEIDHAVILTGSTMIAQAAVCMIGIIAEKDVWKAYISPKRKMANYSQVVSQKELLKYGMPFVFASLCNWVFTGADKVMIKMFSNGTELGIYASAVSIVGIFGVITTTFATVWGPMAVEEYEKGNEGKSFFVKANDYVCVILFLAGAGVVLFKDIIVYLLGEDYRAAVFLIPFLTLHPIMYTISESTVYGINFAKKTKYHLYISIICSSVNIVMNYFMIQWIGSLGAAMSTGITYTLFFALRTAFSLRCYHVDYRLKRFVVLAVLYYIFIIYNSFYPIDYISVLLFIVVMIALVALYKTRMVELAKLACGYVISLKRRHD